MRREKPPNITLANDRNAIIHDDGLFDADNIKTIDPVQLINNHVNHVL